MVTDLTMPLLVAHHGIRKKIGVRHHATILRRSVWHRRSGGGSGRHAHAPVDIGTGRKKSHVVDVGARQASRRCRHRWPLASVRHGGRRRGLGARGGLHRWWLPWRGPAATAPPASSPHTAPPCTGSSSCTRFSTSITSLWCIAKVLSQHMADHACKISMYAHIHIFHQDSSKID